MKSAENHARPRTTGRAEDAATAAELAKAAGQLLLAHREKLSAGEDPDQVRKQGDILSHNYIFAELSRRFPSDAVLSEEGADNLARLTAERVWIVDPLDGTREYGEPCRSDWAVHIALIENGSLTTGAVSMPALGVTYASSDNRTERDAITQVRVVVSRTRRPEQVMRMAASMGAELIEMGSAGAKAMAIVCGDADIYAHAGGQYEWDSAAPVAVAHAAGLHVSRIDGSELRYNQENPWLPDLLICRPELAPKALEELGR